MTVIQIQIAKNLIENALLDGRFKVGIIIKGLCVQLRLSKPKLAPYNLHMVHQTIAKSLSLIKDLKIHVHGIPYTITLLLKKVMY
jgi:hypothetical protein